jgi:hypothetical protein
MTATLGVIAVLVLVLGATLMIDAQSVFEIALQHASN